jgi:hypothetical protein
LDWIAALAVYVTNIAAAITILYAGFKFFFGKRAVCYAWISPTNENVANCELHLQNITVTPIVAATLRILWPRGTSIGKQTYLDVSTDPADPNFIPEPVVFGASVTVELEVEAGEKASFSFLLRDSRSRFPIMVLSIRSTRSIIRTSFIVVSIIHKLAIAKNT